MLCLGGTPGSSFEFVRYSADGQIQDSVIYYADFTESLQIVLTVKIV